MENNNLGDFIRGKLNQTSSGEDWANPDEKVNASVLNKISVSKKSGGVGKKTMAFIGGAMISLLFLGAFIYMQNETINELSQKVKLQKEELTSQKTEAMISKEAISTRSSIELLETKKELEKLTSENAKLIDENTALIHKSKGHQRQAKKKSNQLVKPRQEIEKSTEDNVASREIATADVVQEKTIFENDLAAQKKMVSDLKQREKILLDSISELTAVLPDTATNISTVAAKAEMTQAIIEKKFSVGYDYALNYWDAPVDRNVEEHEVASSKGGFTKVSSMVNGFTFGYAPNPRIRIMGGLRFSRFNMYSAYDLSLAYSSNQETSGSGGSVYNRFNLTTSTPYNTMYNEAIVSFDESTAPSDGDFIGCFNEVDLSFNEYQIPLGVEYLLSAKRTRFFFQAGIQLNFLQLQDFSHNTYLYDSEFNLLETISNDLSSNEQKTNLILVPMVHLALNNPFLQIFI
tara:strand:+ start:5251 stop:6633 length:1383 start_codon:yes stop_codon:yes gene_type:complete